MVAKWKGDVMGEEREGKRWKKGVEVEIGWPLE